ncbi:MAG: CehA/McbA family metallohydrolase, partial [Opitutaceae bacterium]
MNIRLYTLVPFVITLGLSIATVFAAESPPLPIIREVEWQPLAAQVQRVVQALDVIGEPLRPPERSAIEAALKEKDPAKLQAALDRRCLFGVNINPEMRVKVQQGPAKPELLEQGWRSFLVKVHNEAGTTAALQAVSPNALAVYEHARDATLSRAHYRDPNRHADPDYLWLDLSMYDKQPLRENLGGLPLEYRIVQLFSRDAGRREGKIAFNAGQGTQDLGFRNEVDILFTCEAAHPVVFRVHDEKSQPTIAAFLIRDAQGRVYPLRSKRLEPDFFFQQQVYRADGEIVRLPAGRYSIEMSRGPESIVQKSVLNVPVQKEAAFKVERWIDPANFGWWSGDHHIHAAGCSHYIKPTEGVLPSA